MRAREAVPTAPARPGAATPGVNRHQPATDAAAVAALGAAIGNRALGRVLARRRWLLRRTDTPADITVHQEDNGKVRRVSASTGDLTFYVVGVDTIPDTIPEGAAVVTMNGTKVSVVRFANDAVAGSAFAGLGKVKFTVARALPTVTVTVPVSTKRTLDFKVSLTGGVVDERFQGFEGEESGNQHFAKHGPSSRRNPSPTTSGRRRSSARGKASSTRRRSATR